MVKNKYEQQNIKQKVFPSWGKVFHKFNNLESLKFIGITIQAFVFFRIGDVKF